MFIRSAILGFGKRNKKPAEDSDPDADIDSDKNLRVKDAGHKPEINGHAEVPAAGISVEENPREKPFACPASHDDPYELNGFTFGPLWHSFGWVGGIYSLGTLLEALERPVRRAHSHYDYQLQVVHSAFGFRESGLEVDNEMVGKDLHLITADLVYSPNRMSPAHKQSVAPVPVEIRFGSSDDEKSQPSSFSKSLPDAAAPDLESDKGLKKTPSKGPIGARGKKKPAATAPTTRGLFLRPTAASAKVPIRKASATTSNRRTSKDVPTAASNRKAVKESPAKEAPAEKAAKEAPAEKTPAEEALAHSGKASLNDTAESTANDKASQNGPTETSRQDEAGVRSEPIADSKAIKPTRSGSISGLFYRKGKQEAPAAPEPSVSVATSKDKPKELAEPQVSRAQHGH
eukprot:5163147-Pyramimonas_sp.AAC.1